MRDKKMKTDSQLSGLIRKQLGRDANRSFLARMPAFKADGSLPVQLSALLGELDHAEARPNTLTRKRG